ncbi:MAG: VWA domain-containing protein [Pseudomonadota bacterium]
MPSKRITSWFQMLVLCLLTHSAWAASFTADLIQVEAGETRQGRIYVADQTYRLEMTEEGREIIVLVDQQVGKTRVVVPGDQVYLEFASSNMRSLSNDPFRALRYSIDKFESRDAGSVTLHGFACRKSVISIQDKEAMTAWTATDLDFPIKIVQHSETGRFVELRNIRQDAVDPELFAVPAGFRRVERMPIAPPAWAKGIPGAPVMKPPINKILSAPQIIRVKITPGTQLKVLGKRQGQAKATFTAGAFKDGRPVKSFSSFTPDADGARSGVTYKQTPAEADEVVIYVRRGTLLMAVERISGSAVKGEQPASAPASTQGPAPTTPASTPKSVSQAASGPVMLVLDASGSMWGQIGGKAKIQIAREVIGELMVDWDSAMDLGLMAYGHRRKGDCSDIQTLIQAGKANPNAVAKAVGKIQPKGKTPLSEAVRQAAVGLGYTERAATVLLVSDGIETCDADPCAVGTELGMNGLDFTVHVIGFDLKKEEQTGLRCLAERTGGLFLAASDARELHQALTQAVAKAKAPPRPVIETPGTASIEAPEQVPAGSIFEVQWDGSNSRGDFITIVKPGATEGSYQNYAYTATGNPVKLMAPDQVGAYELRYVFGHKRDTLARRAVSVTPVQASLAPEPEVAAGSFLKIDWQGPNNRGDYISLAAVGTGDGEYLTYAHTLNGTPASIQVPDESGAYEVRYVTGQTGAVLARGQVNVTAVSAWVRPPAEVTAGAVFAVEWKGPNNRSDYITIVKPGAADSKYGEYAYTSAGSPAKLHAPPELGTYQIRYVLDQSRTVIARADVTVTLVSASVSAPDSVAAGNDFQVSWQGPNYPSDYITIVPAGSADTVYKSYAYTSSGSSVTLKAPAKPGDYEVRYIVDQTRTALARQPVRVE